MSGGEGEREWLTIKSQNGTAITSTLLQYGDGEKPVTGIVGADGSIRLALPDGEGTLVGTLTPAPCGSTK